MSQLKWYFEDFTAGQVIETGSVTVTEEEIITFAKQFDPQSFHIDPEAASHSIYGGVIASGWHTCCLMMRLVVDSFLGESASMGSPGMDEVRWIKPVRGGDTLSVRCVTLEARPSASKPDRGVVISSWEARNQHGDLVTSAKVMAMFRCRPLA